MVAALDQRVRFCMIGKVHNEQVSQQNELGGSREQKNRPYDYGGETIQDNDNVGYKLSKVSENNENRCPCGIKTWIYEIKNMDWHPLSSSHLPS